MIGFREMGNICQTQLTSFNSYSLTRLIREFTGTITSSLNDHAYFRLRMQDLSKPLLNYLMAVATSRLSSLLAHAIISSSVITSSSSAWLMIFLETIWPTSVDLSRKGRSLSSYRSKSTISFEGWHSNQNTSIGQTVRSGRLSLLLEERPDRSLLDWALEKTSALNCLVIMGASLGCWLSCLLQSVEDTMVSAEKNDLLVFRVRSSLLFF